MKIRQFYNETFGFAVRIVWPVSPEQFCDYVRKKVNPEYENPGDFEAICYKGPHDIILGFQRWSGCDEDIGMLAHEIFHAAHAVLYHRGITLSEETAEVFAYLLESLFDRSLRLMRRK